MRRLRVLYLEPSALISGGSIALLRVVEVLDRRRFRPIVVLGANGPLVERFKQIPGCRVLLLPFSRRLAAVTRSSILVGGMLNVYTAVAYAWRVRRIAAALRVDVIHSNGLKMHLLSVFARGRERRLVWHIRDFVGPPYMPRRTAWIVRQLVRRVPNVVICNSEATRSTVLVEDSIVVESGVPERPVMFRTVPDGISRAYGTPDADARTAFHRVVMLGRLASWKGQHVFVEAARRLCVDDRSTQFLIAGDATTAEDAAYASRLHAAVTQAQVGGQVRFLGVVENVPRLLAETDLLVHCSISPEPFGQVILEAMTCGVPVIATALGGPLEIIQDRVNGILVSPGDDAVLAATIRAVLDDPGLRLRLAKNALRTVHDRFSIERAVEKLVAIYDEPAHARRLAMREPA